MPFYEYECANCKFYTELMQKISDPPLKKCPSCGKSTMKKLISAPVFRLKGGGWYETDFKSDKESKRNLAGDSSDGPDGKSRDAAPADTKAGDSKPAEGKTEAKPAEKPAASESGARKRTTTSKPTRPAARAAVRKSAPKAKAKAKSKASKRRGR